MEKLKILEKWYNIAILDMTLLDDFVLTPKIAAKRLGIPFIEAKHAIERLKKFGLLEFKNNKLQKTSVRLVTSDDKSNVSLRKFHQQMLSQASDALDKQNIDRRYFRAKTMTVSKKHLPKFKELIQDFLSKASDLIAQSEEKNVLYQLNVRLFDLEKNKDGI